MSKLLLCLILLLGIYKCETYIGAMVYDMVRDGDAETTEVELKVPKGKDFALKFRGNPSTGYTWVLLNTEAVNGPLLGINFDDDGIGSYVPNSTDKNLLGGSGHFYYRFKALKVSNEPLVLNFSYRRIWGKIQNDVPDFAVKITVS